jgi:hypothetical protein
MIALAWEANPRKAHVTAIAVMYFNVVIFLFVFFVMFIFGYFPQLTDDLAITVPQTKTTLVKGIYLADREQITM